MKPHSLQELYIEQLQDLYDAEQQILKALPKMIDAATSQDLTIGLTEHLEITKQQATRIKDILETLGEKAKGEKCKGMQGVLAEGSELVEGIDDPDIRDAAIIASAQRVEHYEIAGYGTARTYAELLKEDTALLQQTLEEEKDADQKLTALSRKINVNAATRKTIEGEETSVGKKKRVA